MDIPATYKKHDKYENGYVPHAHPKSTVVQPIHGKQMPFGRLLSMEWHWWHPMIKYSNAESSATLT